MKKIIRSMGLLGVFCTSFMVGMVKKTVPTFQKFIAPLMIVEPVRSSIWYGDVPTKDFFDEVYFSALMNRAAMNLGVSSYVNNFAPKIEYDLSGVVQKNIGQMHGHNVLNGGLSRFDLLTKRAKELDLYFALAQDDSKEDDLLDPLMLGDIVKDIAIEKPINIKNIAHQVEKAKVDSVFEVLQWFGMQNEFWHKKDIVDFLQSEPLRKIQQYVNVKIREAQSLQSPDITEVLLKGLESNSVSVQIATLKTFFAVVGASGLPIGLPIPTVPLVLTAGFGHALCEKIIGHSLTPKEYVYERSKRMFWLRPLEAGIMLVLWIVLVFVNCKFVSVLYHEMQGGNDEYRDKIALAAHLEMEKLESEMN